MTDETEQAASLDYMILARYQQGLGYYYGHGNLCEKHLYFQDLQEHVKQTRAQWEKVDPKPEWFTEDELEHFERRAGVRSATHGTYKVFSRKAWRASSSVEGGFEPDPRARKTTMYTGLTHDEARAKCQAHNAKRPAKGKARMLFSFYEFTAES